MSHHSPAGGHEFLDILRRALSRRHDRLPAARTVRLTVMLLALHLGFPWHGSPMPDMARLAARPLATGVLATAPRPAGPDPMAALPLFEFALQLLKLPTQGRILVSLLLKLLTQLRILAFQFLDTGLLCHAPRG
jgi:hypothetical protein